MQKTSCDLQKVQRSARGRTASKYNSMQFDNSKQRNKFSPEEDKKLTELVEKLSEGKDSSFTSISDGIWDIISDAMPNRNVRQCHDRWVYYLSPTVKKGPWTKEEDELLLSLIGTVGLRWVKLSKMIPGRTDIQIKNRYNLFKKSMGDLQKSLSPIPIKIEEVKVEPVKVEPVKTSLIDFDSIFEDVDLFEVEEFSLFDDLFDM